MTPTSIQIPTSPRDLGLDFDAYRPGQHDVVRAIVHWYLERDEPFMFLEAPTGVGKSLIAAAVIEVLRREHEGRFKAVIETVSKTLQTQYAESTLPNAQVAWGKGNHQCLVIPEGDPDDAPCSYGYRCKVKDQCSYYVERDAAQVAPTSILNTPFLLAGANYVELSQQLLANTTIHPSFDYMAEQEDLHLFEGAHLMVHDEAHLLEGAIRNHVEVKLNYEFFAQIGSSLPPTNNSQVWDTWLENTVPLVTGMAEEYKAQARMAARDGMAPSAQYRLHKRAVGYDSQLRFLANRLLPTRPYIDLTTDQRNVLFRAVWGAPFADSILFRKAHKHLLMSATIIHPDAMARSLGIKPDDYVYYEMDSPFPPMLRRVLDIATVKVNYRTTEAQFRGVVAQMDDAIETHIQRGEKGIIHSVSYQRARDILKFSRYRAFMISHTQGEKGGKEAAIQRYLEQDGTAILVSPSVSVGEDFGRGANCRFQVFTKYPVPNIGDPIVKARLEDDSESLYVEADRSFVQAVGRGMRSPDDYCTNYVLDSGARWRFGRLPKWFQTSIVTPRK